MFNSNDLLNFIKKAAIEAVEASQPCDFCFGKIMSVLPIKVLVEQKMTLSAAQLILTESMTVNNPLEVGDEVILLKKKGGQKYLVLDKAVKI